jgi:iron complex outermembrane recepter protein
MKKITLLSMAAIAALATEPVTIQKITVEASAPKADSKSVTADEMVKFSRQSDLGEMLSSTLPEITHVRASAVGNDIILRGLKKDNINVTIDDAKVCGACPNRMDPPAMHVSSSQIQTVEVKEGPFDVTQFGSLGGTVNVVTKDPQKGIHGEVSVTAGSFDYQKTGATIEGGNDTVQALIGYSYETSGQYKDGDGKTMAEQLVAKGAAIADQYKTNEKNRDAYDRKNFWNKIVFTPTDTDKITLSYFGDRADDVLYPAFGMDAQVDDTDMFSAKYQKTDLSSFSDELKLEAYHSKVEHEMGTEFRNSGTGMTYRTHAVEATIKGVRIENTATLADIKTILGIDTSNRNWNGVCKQEPTDAPRQTRIPDVDTDNLGIYIQGSTEISHTELSAGLRYDMTSIDPDQGLGYISGYSMQTTDVRNYLKSMPERDFNNISANLMAKYNFSPSSNVFIGVGQSVRVPDARELYFVNDMNIPVNNGILSLKGNTALNETVNRELDIGAEYSTGNLLIKGTMFYSDLKDYIYTYSTGMTTTFANIDAKIVGFDLKADYAINNEWIIEMAMAYQKGTKKDTTQLDNLSTLPQTDNDLAEIPPLKGRIALVFDTSSNYAMVEWIGARFQSIDSDNGEKEIGGYGILNLKYGYDFQNGFSLMAGINNLFDKTYAVSNSYIGRGLITGTTTQPTILNELGRNFYATVNYKF